MLLYLRLSYHLNLGQGLIDIGDLLREITELELYLLQFSYN